MPPVPYPRTPAASAFSSRPKASTAAARTTSPSANAAVDRSLQHNYIGRKEKKRNFRALWIQRINAACRLHGLTYSRFISGLAQAGIEIDRKVLADLAMHEPEAFKALVEQVRG